MKPGPELDALIAGQVMGWELLHYGCPEPAWFEPGKFHSRRHLPAFSTDIAAAWMIVERMQSQGWGYELSDMTNGEHCMLFIRWDPDAGANAGGKTPAEAICKAALKALAEG